MYYVRTYVCMYVRTYVCMYVCMYVCSVFARPGPKNMVNTAIFATRSNKHCKYRGFGLPRRQKHQYVRCFLLRECQKNAKTPPI